MARMPRVKPFTPEFEEALAAAAVGEGPSPLCKDRTFEFTDYITPPTAKQAAELCADCPLISLCLDDARRTKPKWGVQGGVAWEGGVPVELARKGVA